MFCTDYMYAMCRKLDGFYGQNVGNNPGRRKYKNTLYQWTGSIYWQVKTKYCAPFLLVSLY